METDTAVSDNGQLKGLRKSQSWHCPGSQRVYSSQWPDTGHPMWRIEQEEVAVLLHICGIFHFFLSYCLGYKEPAVVFNSIAVCWPLIKDGKTLPSKDYTTAIDTGLSRPQSHCFGENVHQQHRWMVTLNGLATPGDAVLTTFSDWISELGTKTWSHPMSLELLTKVWGLDRWLRG